jgi:hypothetical protein
MICPKCKHKFKDPGRSKGGKKSKRVLSPNDARKMVEAREAKKKAKDTKDG